MKIIESVFAGFLLVTAVGATVFVWSMLLVFGWWALTAAAAMSALAAVALYLMGPEE